MNKKNIVLEFDVTEPKDGRVVMMNRYWQCADGDPKRALFWRSYDYPQCNKSEFIVEMFPVTPSAKICFIEIAYVPERTRD